MSPARSGRAHGRGKEPRARPPSPCPDFRINSRLRVTQAGYSLCRPASARTKRADWVCAGPPAASPPRHPPPRRSCRRPRRSGISVMRCANSRAIAEGDQRRGRDDARRRRSAQLTKPPHQHRIHAHMLPLVGVRPEVDLRWGRSERQVDGEPDAEPTDRQPRLADYAVLAPSGGAHVRGSITAL